MTFFSLLSIPCEEHTSKYYPSHFTEEKQVHEGKVTHTEADSQLPRAWPRTRKSAFRSLLLATVLHLPKSQAPYLEMLIQTFLSLAGPGSMPEHPVTIHWVNSLDVRSEGCDW